MDQAEPSIIEDARMADTETAPAAASAGPSALAVPSEPKSGPIPGRIDRETPQRMRNDPEAIRHAFETGEFPYRTRLGT